MSDQYSALRKNVRKLGDILGDTLAEAEGEDLLVQVEKIRLLSKAARSGDVDSHQQLLTELNQLSGDRLVAVVRSFNQFLNLANIADQHHTISRDAVAEFSATNTLK